MIEQNLNKKQEVVYRSFFIEAAVSAHTLIAMQMFLESSISSLSSNRFERWLIFTFIRKYEAMSWAPQTALSSPASSRDRSKFVWLVNDELESESEDLSGNKRVSSEY